MSKMTLVLALTVGVAVSASASIISVNATDGGSLGTSAAQTAGAALAGYWNEIKPDTTAAGTTDLNDLLDDSGTASGVTLAQSSHIGGWWNSDSYPSGFSGTVGNDMFGNFADNSGAYTYTFDNLNTAVGSLYDVYIYSARGFSNTGVTQFDVNGETKFLANENTAGDYAESGWSTAAGAMANLNSGNYVRFSNVNLNTLVIGIDAVEDTVNSGTAGSVAGIQIVAIPEPATLGLISAFGVGVLFIRRRLSM